MGWRIAIATPNHKDLSYATIPDLPGGNEWLYGIIQKQIKKLDSYVLGFDDNIITREMLDTEEVSVYQHELNSIERNHLGGLTINGIDHDIIYVPKEIERMDLCICYDHDAYSCRSETD